MRIHKRIVALLLVAVLAPSLADATWSIIITDRETNETAIGAATCLANFNLKRALAVVKVDVGAAAAQSYIDTIGVNRALIWNELDAGTHPEQILLLLDDQDSAHQTRQYGIVDTRGRAATFSGDQNGVYANGVTGTCGPLTYSIQGNVITGQALIDAAEAAVLNTPGDIPEKLMAAMEAARDMGGDGRCSCSPDDPTGCGAPPPDFEKSAHVGFMIVTRRGDIDGLCNRNRGCANGAYFLTINIYDQDADAPDPVDQMRERFDTWRAETVGVPDAVASTVTLTPDLLFNDGVGVATMRIEIKDWQGLPASGVEAVTVEHDENSAASSTIGPITDLGDGVYELQVAAGTIIGKDRLVVRVTQTDAVVRMLIPNKTLWIRNQRADLNHDGVLDLADLLILLEAYGVSDGGDIDADGDTDLSDLAELLAYRVA